MKKLPKDFCIESFQEHRLWGDFIEWMRSEGSDYSGRYTDSYYGMDNGSYHFSVHPWAKVITLEQWHEAVNAKSDFPEPVFITKSGIEIYDEVEMLVWDNAESLARKEKITAKNDNFYFTLSPDGFIATWKNAKPIPEEVEVTMEEIAKWKGVDVKQIKIK